MSTLVKSGIVYFLFCIAVCHSISFKIFSSGSWENAVSICKGSGGRIILYDNIDTFQDRQLKSSSLIPFPFWFDFFFPLNQEAKANSYNDYIIIYNRDACGVMYNVRKYYILREKECETKNRIVCEYSDEISSTSSTSSTSKEIKSSTTVPSTTDKTTLEPTSKPDYCPPKDYKQISWPKIGVDQIISMKCPTGSEGKARWGCVRKEGHPSHFPPSPDMSECISSHVSELITNVKKDGLMKTFDFLNEMLQDERGLFGGDIEVIIDLFGELKEHFSEEFTNKNESQMEEKALEMGGKFVTSGSLIVESYGWKDIPQAKRSVAGSDLLKSVDDVGFLIGEHLIEETVQQFSQPNMELSIHRPNKNNLNANFVSQSGKISLPDSLNTSLVVFSAFRNLSSILSTFKPFSSTISEPRKFFVSSVISASLFEANSFKLGDEKVRFSIKHDQDVSSNLTICVFWNLTSNQWDDNGCSLIDDNATHAVCECDHLTNFAILVDVSGSVPITWALRITTIVGCAISIFCLALTLLIFTLVKKPCKLPTLIHQNLCLCLLIGNSLLIGGVDETSNKTACKWIAILLQFFFQAVFFWMLLESVHIYFLLVKVFATENNHKIRYYLTGYGIPFIIVIISYFTDQTSYGTDEYCWLTPNSIAIWIHVGIIILILLINLGAFILALKTTLKLKKNSELTLIEKSKKWLRVTAVLLPLLGLTWGLGFFFYFDDTMISIYVFTILNSLQGVCIFIFHCILDVKTRKAILSFFRRRTITLDYMRTYTTQLKSNSRTSRSGQEKILNNSSSEDCAKSKSLERESKTSRRLSLGNRNTFKLNDTKLDNYINEVTLQGISPNC